MSFPKGAQITSAGLLLQAKAETGVQLLFTKMQVGSGQTISAWADLTALVAPVKDIPITRLNVVGNNSAIVGGYFSNFGLDAGFDLYELGVFALDPDVGEILYGYANAGNDAESIPADNGLNLFEKFLNIIAIIGAAQDVTANIDMSALFITQNDLSAQLLTKLDKSNVARAPAVGEYDENGNITSPDWPVVPVDYGAITIAPPNDVANDSLIVINNQAGIPLQGKLKAGIPVTLRYYNGSFFLANAGSSSSGGSVIKSVQHGASMLPSTTGANITQNHPISNIDVSKSFAYCTVITGTQSSGALFTKVNILNSNTIQLYSGYKYYAEASLVYFTVINFDNIKSIQKGTLTTTATPHNITISNVDINKCLVFISHTNTTQTVSAHSRHLIAARLISPNTLSFEAMQAGNDINWAVVETN